MSRCRNFDELNRLKTWRETLDQVTEWHYSAVLIVGRLQSSATTSPHFSQGAAEFASIQIAVSSCRNSGAFRYGQSSAATRVIMLLFWKIWLKKRPVRDVRMRRSAGRQWALAAEVLEWRAMLSVNVLTFHNDIAGTGANIDESALTPVDVVPNSRFGKLFATNVLAICNSGVILRTIE